MQQFGDYTFRDSPPEPDVSALGKPALFTPRQFLDVVALAAGVGAVLVAVLLVLFS